MVRVGYSCFAKKREHGHVRQGTDEFYKKYFSII